MAFEQIFNAPLFSWSNQLLILNIDPILPGEAKVRLGRGRIQRIADDLLEVDGPSGNGREEKVARLLFFIDPA